MTACAQACPSNAITFGNLKDAESPIAKIWQEPRSYDLFGELNTKPGVNYMGKLTFQEVGGGHHGDDHAEPGAATDSHSDGGDAGGHH
jgi:ferredoxin